MATKLALAAFVAIPSLCNTATARSSVTKSAGMATTLALAQRWPVVVHSTHCFCYILQVKVLVKVL